MKKKSSKNNRGFIPVLAVIFGVIFAFVGLIILYQVRRAPKAPAAATGSTTDRLSTTAAAPAQEKPDALTYYAENSKQVLAIIPAASSEDTCSEQAVGKELASRGFGDSAATYEYNMDGSMVEKTQIDTASATTHPQYSLLYTTKSGDYWTVTVSNGSVTAYPVSYNLEHNSGTEVICSENESITAYDSESNCFYETIPKPSVLRIKHLPAITADVLEQLTAQEIDKL